MTFPTRNATSVSAVFHPSSRLVIRWFGSFRYKEYRWAPLSSRNARRQARGSSQILNPFSSPHFPWNASVGKKYDPSQRGILTCLCSLYTFYKDWNWSLGQRCHIKGLKNEILSGQTISSITIAYKPHHKSTCVAFLQIYDHICSILEVLEGPQKKRERNVSKLLNDVN